MRSAKAMKNVISSLVLQVIAIIYGFIVPKLIIESFGSNVNGLISSITQFLAYITLLESGIGPVVKATLYGPIAKKDKEQIKNILKASERFFRIIAFIFLIYLVILSIVYPIIVSAEFDFIYTMSLIMIISISTFAEYYIGMTYKLYLQAEQKTYVTSIIQIVSYILNTIAIVILIKCDASIHIIKLVSGIIFILRPVMQNLYVKKKYNINLKEADKNYQLKQKWDGLAQHIAAVIHDNTDVAILTIFSEMSEVSVYTVYYIVVKGVKSLIRAITGGIDAAFGDMLARGEKDILNRNFEIYELLYFSIITVTYSCIYILIVPFIKVYTLGITDANYIRPVFAVLLVSAEFVWAVRQPYNDLVKTAGHFKQTRIGAWIEAITNVVISVVLVYKFGIVGVAIGTLVAMTIRTLEFIYYVAKNILNRSIFVSFKKIAIIIIETLLIVCIVNMLPELTINSYVELFLKAVITAVIAIIVTLGINIAMYKTEMTLSLDIIKRNFGRFKRKEKQDV